MASAHSNTIQWSNTGVLVTNLGLEVVGSVFPSLALACSSSLCLSSKLHQDQRRHLHCHHSKHPQTLAHKKAPGRQATHVMTAACYEAGRSYSTQAVQAVGDERGCSMWNGLFDFDPEVLSLPVHFPLCLLAVDEVQAHQSAALEQEGHQDSCLAPLLHGQLIHLLAPCTPTPLSLSAEASRQVRAGRFEGSHDYCIGDRSGRSVPAEAQLSLPPTSDSSRKYMCPQSEHARAFCNRRGQKRKRRFSIRWGHTNGQGCCSKLIRGRLWEGQSEMTLMHCTSPGSALLSSAGGTEPICSSP